MVAEAIVEGRALIVRSISPELARMAKPDLLGRPLCEAYTEPGYKPVLAQLEFVRVSGCPMNFLFTTPYGLSGWVSLRPLGDDRVLLRFRQVPRSAQTPLPLRSRVRDRGGSLVAAMTAAVLGAAWLPV